MSDCFVLYLLLTCMKKKTSGADKFTNNSNAHSVIMANRVCKTIVYVLSFQKSFSPI